MASQLPPEEWPVTRPATGSCLPWATLWGQEGQRGRLVLASAFMLPLHSEKLAGSSPPFP